MIRSATHGRKTASTVVTGTLFSLLLGMTTTAAFANAPITVTAYARLRRWKLASGDQ
jgi:hypothetical protein